MKVCPTCDLRYKDSDERCFADGAALVPMQDPRIGNTVAPTEEKMKMLGKTYEPHIMDGAAHGFLRAQTGNDGANMKATEFAWPATIAWLKKYTS